MAGYCDNFSMIDGDSSNFSMTDGGDQFYAFPGLKGEDGTTFYPHVSAEGVLSWTNDGGKPNPDPVNIKGADGKSAYEAAVEAGFTGTESEFNEYLSGIGDLTALTNRKAGMLVDTASGAIASFVPDSTIDNLLGVTVAVEPVQDLHGQASPWPAGGGKNLFDSSVFSETESETISYLHYEVQNGTYTMSTPDFPLVDGIANVFFLAGAVSSGASSPVHGVSQSIPRTITVTDGYYTVAYRTINNRNTNKPKDFKWQIESGNSATAYAPYENLCPISGWSAVGIGTAGENLIPFPYADSTKTHNGITWTVNADGTVRAQGTATGNSVFYVASNSTISRLSYLNGKTVMLSGCPAGGSSNTYFMYSWHTVGGTTSALDTGNGFSYTMGIMPDSDITLQVRNGTTVDVVFKPQLELGAVKTAFKPYTGNTYAIALGQTVYGGTLDVVNGTMTVDRAMFTWTSTSGGYLSTTKAYCLNRSDVVKIDPTNQTTLIGAICDKLKSATWADIASKPNEYSAGCVYGNGLAFRIPGLTTASEYTAWLADNPLTFVYLLKTPIEIQLDPVTISTISGQTNNLWSDAGDVDVTYAADIKAYIDRLNQPIEEDMVANNLIASGKYFTINNRLFLSTASIAAGAMIIPGTNCTETSLAAALNALNA